MVGPRFPSDVTAFYCEQSGIVVVAGLADFLVRVINTSDFTTVSLKEHAAPVLSVALAKEGNVVAICSCACSVKVRNRRLLRIF